MHKLVKTTLAAAVLSAGVTGTAVAEEEKVLNVYNWSDYIAEDTLANFEAETGIKVTYDVFDSNEVLEAKLLAGNTGFDVVVPSLSFLARQIQAGVFMPLDKSKLTNYGNQDEGLMQTIATLDEGNTHSIPYLWGTTGIGFNVDKVKEVLGEDAPTDSWDLVYDPANLEKLHSCGVAFLDAPSEIIPGVLHYLGEDPNTFDTKLIKGKAQDHLMKLRPHITYFHSSQFINDLANGDICVAVGWSGDILQASDRAAEAENGVEVAYVIPKEGALTWYDMLAIPKDAKHPNNAHLFLNYLLRPDVMAGISNYVWYASANKASLPMVDQEILDHPGIYPTEDAAKNLWTGKMTPPKVDRAYTRTWTKVKTGK
ncbi:MAG: spermidine/putrescine ABC transporter substrate-binding protein PotF [Candidatus Pelagadaptatus aseana]|uniref:extracellular solute-binding protein n=1 Tax=Candidatus Pelagadaptatus aseana TaxID=3120508 RepID=UPI0039B18F76